MVLILYMHAFISAYYHVNQIKIRLSDSIEIYIIQGNISKMNLEKDISMIVFREWMLTQGGS